MVVHVPYMSEAEIAAARKQQDSMRLVKEIGEWQQVIVGQLEQLIRGGPPDAIRKRISEASAEYGERLGKLLKDEPYRLSGPARR
jgi:hypothetical protein